MEEEGECGVGDAWVEANGGGGMKSVRSIFPKELDVRQEDIRPNLELLGETCDLIESDAIFGEQDLRVELNVGPVWNVGVIVGSGGGHLD